MWPFQRFQRCQLKNQRTRIKPSAERKGGKYIFGSLEFVCVKFFFEILN
jgi:hypothetical protein